MFGIKYLNLTIYCGLLLRWDFSGYNDLVDLSDTLLVTLQFLNRYIFI